MNDKQKCIEETAETQAAGRAKKEKKELAQLSAFFPLLAL
jgi:hypothetical protein